DLDRRAQEKGKRLATLAVDTEVRFRSATERAAFTSELTEAITKLVSKYHDESAPGGRAHRLVVVAHPLPQQRKGDCPPLALSESLILVGPTDAARRGQSPFRCKSHPKEPS